MPDQTKELVSGTLTSRYRTGDSSEALTSSPEILSLAKQLLSEAEFDRAMKLSVMLVSSRSVKNAAVEELVTMVAPPPKRPLYYAQHELELLPRWTRDAIRYLGDYVDVVCKHLLYELSKARGRGNTPLGVTISTLEARKVLPDNVLTRLRTYNEFLYRPGKHDFHLPAGRKMHRFTSQEVVLTAFVTLRLVEILKQYSKCAPDMNCHFDNLI